ncbi:MAG: GNAT family N-acetyltransferase [Chitinophagaceae bacterium]|nr:MAG: GNAT family N-acetyltransferase [Chitinophagaceae bacterium]
MCKSFEQLTVAELYSMLRLRSEVFVVEQNCVYLDTDGRDTSCHHLCGWLHNQLVAYCRIVPPGLAFEQPSIGRVLTHAAHRKDGYGKILMQKAISKTYELYDAKQIKISAQLYLLQFYKDLGFEPVGGQYLEDDIPHIAMLHSR